VNVDAIFAPVDLKVGTSLVLPIRSMRLETGKGLEIKGISGTGAG